ncbi:MAG: hypothetical protein ACP5M9_01425 [Candidatus Micrarchaeia archaeon]
MCPLLTFILKTFTTEYNCGVKSSHILLIKISINSRSFTLNKISKNIAILVIMPRITIAL